MPSVIIHHLVPEYSQKKHLGIELVNSFVVWRKQKTYASIIYNQTKGETSINLKRNQKKKSKLKIFGYDAAATGVGVAVAEVAAVISAESRVLLLSW